MTALLRAELGRALSRRLFLILLVLLVVGIAIGAVITFFTTEESQGPVSRVRFHGRQIEECIQTGEGLAPDVPPEERSSLCRYYNIDAAAQDPRFKFTGLTDVFKGTSVVLVIAAWLVGASFIGAEWHTGNITTVLTWEPRRVRLLTVKLLAVMLVVSVVALLLHVLLGLAIFPTAALRGSTAGLDWEWWKETAGVALRAIGLANVGAVLGFALAAIGRNTAAALGAGFVYLAIVENLVRALKPMWSRWLITDNAFFFVSGDPAVFEFGTRGPGESAALLVAYAVGLLAVAAALFRARDVT